MEMRRNIWKTLRTALRVSVPMILFLATGPVFAQYEVQWSVLNGCSETQAGVIARIPSWSDPCAKAISRNVCPSGIQGWVQVQPQQTDVNKTIGFIKVAPAPIPSQSLCGPSMVGFGIQFMPGGSLRRIVSGVATTIGTYDTTDFIRIELNADSVRYYQNEVKIAASKYTAGDYSVIVLFEQADGHFDYPVCSFDLPAVETVSINQCALISSLTPAVAAPNTDAIRACRVSTTGAIERSLFRFSTDSIPAKAIILSATLSMYCTKALGTYASYLKMVGANWTQAVTWYTKPVTTTTAMVTIAASTVNQYVDIPITAIVQKWVNRESVNYGLELSIKNEALTGEHRLTYQSDFASSNKPIVTIKYITDAPFATLSHETDGGCFNCDNNRLCFVYNEEYFREEDALLCYAIYDETMTAIAGVDNNGVQLQGGSPLAPVQAGMNKYVFDLSEMNIPTGHYYLLEVINAKDEKCYLRFKN